MNKQIETFDNDNTDDQESCFDCGHTVEWSENAGDWVHIGKNLGCFMDHRNTVFSKSGTDAA